MSIIQVPRKKLIRCLTAADLLENMYDAVLFKVSTDKLAITTPALHTWLQQKINIVTKTSGLLPDAEEITRTVPLKSLISVAKTSQTDALDMDLSSPDKIKIVTGTKYSLSTRGYGAEYFLPQEELRIETVCSIEPGKLLRALSRIRFTPDNRRTLSTLWRLKIDPEESKITITYTNGYLMFHIQEAAEIHTDTPFEIVLDTDCARP